MPTKHFFDYKVLPAEGAPSYQVPSDSVSIRFTLRKITASCLLDEWGGDPSNVIEHYYDIIRDCIMRLGVAEFVTPSSRQEQREKLFKVINGMDVPEHERTSIVDQIFIAVEQSDVPGWPLQCIMTHTCVTILSGDKPEVVNPESLSKVKLHNLQDESLRQEACVICTEGLDGLNGVEEGTDADQLTVIRLPCAHMFHENCVGTWLQTSYLCPLCRYELPTMNEEDDEGEPSETSGWPLYLPLIFAGGILTSLIVCKLLKQS